AVLERMRDQLREMPCGVEPRDINEIGAFRVQVQRALNRIGSDQNVRARAEAADLLQDAEIRRAAQNRVGDRGYDNPRAFDVRVVQRVHVRYVTVEGTNPAAVELFERHG